MYCMRVGPQRRLSAKELMPSNCAREDSWESVRLQGDLTVNPKGNWLWIFIGRTVAVAEVEAQYFEHLMHSDDSLEKTLLLGNWGQEKGAIEDEMVGWHQWLNGHESDLILGGCGGPGSLAVLQSMWSLKVEHNSATEQQQKQGLWGANVQKVQTPLACCNPWGGRQSDKT